MATDDQLVYALIRNIPNFYHSKDLRRFFAHFVEAAAFDCFHFRHRPEVQQVLDRNGEAEQSTSETKPVRGEGSGRQENNSEFLGKIVEKEGKDKESKRTREKRFCCVVRLSRENRQRLIIEYDKVRWTNEKENEIALRCFIVPLRISSSDVVNGSTQLTPFSDSSKRITTDNASDQSNNLLSYKDLDNLIELKPPSLMPRGNVGTPSRHFFELIGNCSLPPSVIKKLGLKARKSQRRYGAVAMEYESVDLDQRQFHSIEEKTIERRGKPDNEDGSDNDDDQCEEWERYEAHHDDVTDQDRTKQKLYEEEMEVTWEKGGPGLVWFTDSFYWDQTEQGTDSDWRWADDWDVDFSVYYDKTAGDIDSRQAVEIRAQNMLRSGELPDSVFKRKRDFEMNKKFSQRKRRYSETDMEKLGKFEQHTKGMGAKYLRKFGWQPGEGVGKSCRGRPFPVEPDSNQNTRKIRPGFGYRGPALQRTGLTGPQQKRLITTVYDKREARDEPTQLLRRDLPEKMKQR